MLEHWPQGLQIGLPNSKWPLGFTKMESPAAIIGWVSQDKEMGFTKMESPAAIIGWVLQDQKNGLWALRNWKAQQKP